MIKKKNISQQDVDTWNNYIKNPNDVVDKDDIKKASHSINFRFKFDLHGFTLNDANDKVKEIILTCVKKNYKEILLITGKGIHSNSDQDIYASKNFSKLKYSVPEFIKSNPNISKYIISIASANQSDGGEGALILKIKNL